MAPSVEDGEADCDGQTRAVASKAAAVWEEDHEAHGRYRCTAASC